jgi:phospholipid-binding lipoprotein MlaA
VTKRVLVLLALLSAGACASRDGAPNPDPFEAQNRSVLAFNEQLDANVIRPVAETYRAALPQEVRAGVRNVLRNLNEPVVFANNILQGRLLDAGHTFMRFYFNTTAGVLGIFDLATRAGIERRSGDFGQTLHAWGVPDGPFVVLPLFGPYNMRDAVGGGVDALTNPIGLATGLVFAPVTSQVIGVGRGALGGLDLRAENIETLDTLRSDSLDYYARLRSFVQQQRDAELGRTAAASGEGLITLDDPGASSDPAPPSVVEVTRARPAPR